MGVRTGDRVDVCRAVCRAIYTDDYTANYRAVVEVFIETFVKTIIRLPSILVLRVSRALELHIGFKQSFKQSFKRETPLDPLRTACSISLRGQYNR